MASVRGSFPSFNSEIFRLEPTRPGIYSPRPVQDRWRSGRVLEEMTFHFQGRHKTPTPDGASAPSLAAAMRVIVVGDNTCAALEWLDSVRRHISVITRLRLDAALYEPAPPKKPGTMRRPRKRGARLPTLAQVLADPATEWTRVDVSEWYGKGEREMEIATATALWFHGGLPGVPVRWVLVRDPEKKLDPKAFLSTDQELNPIEILRYFLRGWQIEVTFAAVRRHLGVETQRQWSDRAIARTTPTLLASSRS